MYDIEMHEVSPEFEKCWQAAGSHLDSQVQDGLQAWLRAHLTPPFLEHLSFRLGNQLFFIRIEDVDGLLMTPGSLGGLLAIAEGCEGSACLLPMKKKRFGGGWSPALPGWGLIDAQTREPINPITLVTDEKIEITAWEVHDFAVQVVRDQLLKEGYKLMSWQGNPNVDPAIWFVGDSKGPEWVVVRAVRYPETDAKRPPNWVDIASSAARLSEIGHFASVALVSVDQKFDTDVEDPAPLWRGYGAYIRYNGLNPPYAKNEALPQS